jgi:hypothetical protein
VRIWPCFCGTKATATASWSVLYRPRRLKLIFRARSFPPHLFRVYFEFLVFPGEESAWGAPASSSPLSHPHPTVVRSAPCRSRRPRLPCTATNQLTSPHPSLAKEHLAKARAACLLPAAAFEREKTAKSGVLLSAPSLAFCALDRPLATSCWALLWASSHQGVFSSPFRFTATLLACFGLRVVITASASFRM